MYLSLGAAASASGYGYLYYRCKKVREEAMDSDLKDAKKDATRPSNVYYGINWGYRSDETIEKSLDTGDLLFFSYECLNCFTPEEVMLCYKQQKLNKLGPGDPQNTAFCFRTPQKLLVVYSDLVGGVHIEPYNELLSKPFVKSVQARSLRDPPADLVPNVSRYVDELRALQRE